MASKDKVLDRIDSELSELEENTPYLKRDGAYFSELQIKTAFRNVLYNTPLSESEAELLLENEDILHNIFDYWAVLGQGPVKEDFYEVTRKYLEGLDLHDKYDRLIARAQAEQTEFIETLKQKSPEDIINTAYEIAIKDDIFLEIKEIGKTAKEVSILLTLEKPLQSIYDAWVEKDCSYMDDLRVTVDEVIDKQRDHLDQHQYDQNGKIPEALQEYYTEYENAEDEENKEPADGLEPC